MIKKTSTFIFLFLLGMVGLIIGQQAYFADGYHGGIYGHYPLWQTGFMIEKLAEYPEWKINLEIEPETWDTVSVKDPENFSVFQEYYETQGRFGRIEFVNPMWAQPYCYTISGESIIRQLGYGIAKIKEYFPHAAFTTYSVEEPCFTSCLPQILKGFGYRYAVLRNPNTCWGGYTTGFNKDLVNWIGPDGTTLVAVPRYGCEGLEKNSTWQTESWDNSPEFIRSCFESGVKFPVGMCFQDAGWRHGPWLENAVRRFHRPTTYVTWSNYIEMVSDYVTPEDWAFSLEDVKPGLVWGAQVLQNIAREVRQSENLIVMAEKMAALDYLYNKETWPCEDFAEAWRTLMLAQHHDCWIVPYNGKPGDTWADKVDRWTAVTREIAEEKIFGLFGETPGTIPEYIRVYNTLASTRSGRVEVSLPEDLMNSDLKIFDSKGIMVPSQVFKDRIGNGKLCFEASVPAMGYSTFRLKKDTGKPRQKSGAKFIGGMLNIETDFYSVMIDPSLGGTITSLIDKKNGNRQLVEKGGLLNNLKGFFYDEGKFYRGSDRKAKVTVYEDGEVFTRIKVENRLAGNSYYQLITFNKNNPRIDFELHIDWKGQPAIGAYDQRNHYDAKDRNKAFYNDAYKLHVEFPLAESGGGLYKNAPFDVCESKLKNTLYSSWDSIKHNIILNWVDVVNPEKDYGVALFSDHTTSYIQSDELPLGLTVQYVGIGLWGLEYKIYGPTQLKYALFPHRGDWEQGLVQKASNEWNEPLIANFITASDTPFEQSLFEIAAENLEVASVVVENDDVIVRLYNSSSESEPKKILWNFSADKMVKIDLNGHVVSDVTFEEEPNGLLSTEIILPQFGFQTLKITGIKVNK